jgi:cell division septal protein FtsQ
LKKGFRLILIVAAVLFTALLFLISPLFNITSVVINGCERLTPEEIEVLAGVGKATNIFLFNTSNASKRVRQNLYVDEAVFQKDYPGTLTITIRERRLSGYVEYMDGQYLYIDENGRVLEIKRTFTETYPVVSGLEFSTVRLGEILNVPDSSAFSTVVQYTRLLNDHSITKDVSRIDVKDVQNTRIIFGSIEFIVGDDRNGDEKIRTIRAMLEELQARQVTKIIIDLKELDGQWVGKRLT